MDAKEFELAKNLLMQIDGVEDVGLGFKEVDGKMTDIPALIVKVRQKKDLMDIAPSEQIPAAIGDMPIDVVNSTSVAEEAAEIKTDDEKEAWYMLLLDIGLESWLADEKLNRELQAAELPYPFNSRTEINAFAAMHIIPVFLDDGSVIPFTITITRQGNGYLIKKDHSFTPPPTFVVPGGMFKGDNPITLTEEQYSDYLKPWITTTFPTDTTSFLSSLSPDTFSAESVDHLDFASDVRALAAVIAYEKLQPPLAIGLFGNWGTGKSFFMDKLRDKIIRYSKSGDLRFCTKIVHITFNSWHYSDANLWASLMTRIFEGLQQHSVAAEQTMEGLYENLGSSTALKAELQSKLNQSKAELKILQGEKQAIEKQLAKENADLNTAKAIDVIKTVWETQEVQDEVKVIRQHIPDKDMESVEAIRVQVIELTDGTRRFWQGLKFLWSFRKGNRVWAIVIGIAAMVLAFYCVIYPLATRDFIAWIMRGMTGIIVLWASIWKWIQPAIRHGNRAYKLVSGLDQRYRELQQQKANEKDARIVQLEKVTTDKAMMIAEEEKKVAAVQLQVTALEQDISDIGSGRKLHEFIERRATDPRYTQQLGIISWIRKDFEELDFLLRLQHIEQERIKTGREKIENVFGVDRIILYIDDLDRCNADAVIRVLEAIHLLLAFKLFVVVVGVDPRWMNNAVASKYDELLRGKVKDKPDNARIDHRNGTEKPATSYDYLEKIFQVPFALKPMTDGARKKLIFGELSNQLSLPNNFNIGEQPPERRLIPEGADEGKKVDVHDPQEKSEGTNWDAQPNAAASEQETLKMLEIQPREIKLIQELSFLIGQSPRTIKRYVNMYRIIRTHRDFKRASQQPLKDYGAAIIMLAVITGYPDEVVDWFSAIEKTTDDTNFALFNQGLLKKHKTNGLYTQLKKAAEVTVEGFTPGNLTMDRFKQILPLISRFSFQHVADVMA